MRSSLAFIALAALAACESHETTTPITADASVPALPPDAATADGAAHDALAVMRTDLASNHAGAANRIVTLVNPWGIAIDPDARAGVSIWIAANGSDQALILAPDGTARFQSVSLGGGPTGVVYTGSTELDGDQLVFASEAGEIIGWQDVPYGHAGVRARSSTRAVYKGLAIVSQDPMRLAATDFHDGRIDVFGPGYRPVDQDAAAWIDPDLPAGFAPFGIASFGGDVYVSYAMQDADRHDDVKGAGNGLVDVFRADGTFERRLITRGHLDSPWGMAILPSAFHDMAGKLLVGNFGDGTIHVYDLESGQWMGQLHDASGAPIAIDGLWGLAVGPRTATTDESDRIFFTAGPNDEANGLFGTIAPL